MTVMTKQNRGRRWGIALITIALIAVGGYYFLTQTTVLAGVPLLQSGQAASEGTAAQPPTVAIQPADLAQSAVSAAGKLTLVEERSVALAVSGVVEEIAVDVGDQVKAGDLLLKLNTTELERALAQAQLNVEANKIALADLKTPASEAELAQAQAALVEAQENLADVQAGPSAAEIAAARSALAAAQSSYNELTAGPSEAELTQLSANLKKAEITLQEAQRAYDQVAWRGGSSAEAATLQSATIDYEAAKAAYDEATAPAANSELQAASSSIQSAQVQLDTLLNSPTAAEIATAQARVAEAEAALAELQRGPTDNELRSAEISLQAALIELEAAYRNLAAATVVAPMDGVVLALNAQEGVRSAADTIVATLADPLQLQLVINVAEVDMPRVAVGQPAEIEIDALPGQTFDGVVVAIAPTNDSDATSVSYPVTVRLTDEELAGVLPGMNAVATLINQEPVAEDSWLVPTNALRTGENGATVMVKRGEGFIPVAVTPGVVQGEWTVVQSPELQPGDEVVGSVTSNLNNNSFFGGGGFPGGGPPPGAGFGGGPGGGARP
jgi:HlyD family secretion protein